MKEKNKNYIIGLLIGIIFVLIIVILLILFYKKNDVSGKIKNAETNNITEKEEQIILSESDVRNWLDNHSIINGYFVLAQKDFDSSSATSKIYSDILGWNLLFGGLSQNAVENIQLDSSSGFDYQYTYPTLYIKNLLNDYFKVGIEKIDMTIMNDSFKGYASFNLDKNNMTVKVIATGADIYTSSEINSIKLNDNNEIFVEYNLYDMATSVENRNFIEKRIIVLKKTSNGYNLLKSYKES